jgi:hypothetical protein
LDDVQGRPCHGGWIDCGYNPRLPKKWGTVNERAAPPEDGMIPHRGDVGYGASELTTGQKCCVLIQSLTAFPIED